jgi:hypothetical protein
MKRESKVYKRKIIRVIKVLFYSEKERAIEHNAAITAC